MPHSHSPAPHHGLNARRVSPLRSFAWLVAGWRMFAARPAEWLLISLGAFALLAASTPLVPIPLLGPVLPPLLLALLMGGMLDGAERQSRAENFGFEQLFAGFRLHAGNLTLVGLFYALPLILFNLILYLALSGGLLVSILGISLGATVNSIAASAMGLLADLGIALMVFFLLWGMMVLALLLAPALIMKMRIAPFDAMRLSLYASLRNPGAMFLLALLFYALFMLALLPAGLGILIYIPVVVGAIRTACHELFEQEAPVSDITERS